MFENLVFAQTGPFPSGPSTLVSFLPLILIFAVFYFFLIWPQQKKLKAHKAMLDKLKKNDEVVTSGGIYGKVMALNDQVVTLEVAPNVRIKVQRPQISSMVSPEKAAVKEAKES
jgi:preprotein translocase subunit YajC